MRSFYLPIQDAAADGDLARISECIDKEVFAENINYALLVAADSATAQFLIDAGADVTFRVPRNGLTPLYESIIGNRQDVSLFLIEQGVDVNLPWCPRKEVYRAGETPLMAAAGLGQHQIVDRLIAAGAKVNLRDAKGKLLCLEPPRPVRCR